MATTSTSSTSSVASSLMTALGGGSGIDFNGLAASLSSAQFAGRTDQLSAKSDKLDKQISAASSIKSMLLSLSTSLGDRVRQGDLASQPQLANTAVAKATLSGSSQPTGSYSIEVTALASSQVLASPAYTAATSTVGSGTLTLRFGAVAGASFTQDTAHAPIDIEIAAGATLNDVAAAINAKNAGVTAYIANTTAGAKLVLKGADGATNGFVLDAAETVGDPGLANLAWDPAAAGTGRLMASAADAAFKVDGLAMTSRSNTVTEAVPGVTLNLTGTNIGAPTKLTFSDATAGITGAMQDLVSALNEVAGQLRTATDAQTGDLARDSGALALKRKFAALGTTEVMPGAAEGMPRTLSDLGLAIQRDGSFVLDTTRLAATLKANPQGASAMFTNGLYGVFSTIDGIARGASATSDPGSLAGSISRYSTMKTQIGEDRAKLTEKQEALRAQLVSRFSVTNSQINNSKSTLTFLQNQIAAWNKSGS